MQVWAAKAVCGRIEDLKPIGELLDDWRRSVAARPDCISLDELTVGVSIDGS
jgi:hypothetical protein